MTGRVRCLFAAQVHGIRSFECSIPYSGPNTIIFIGVVCAIRTADEVQRYRDSWIARETVGIHRSRVDT